MARAGLAEQAGQIPEALRLVGEVLKIRDQWEDAIQMRERLVKAQGSQTGKLFVEAQRLDAELKPEEALNKLDTLLKVQRDPKAVQLREKIVERQQKALANVDRTRDLIQRGDRLFGTGNAAMALEVYRQALEWDHYNFSLRRKIQDAEGELQKK